MGMIAHLVVADPAEAETVLDSDDPVNSWDGIAFKGLDAVRLTTLWSLVETGSPEDRLDERLETLREIQDRDEGRWVTIMPSKMIASLASLAEIPEEFERLARAWGSSDEFEGWDQTDLLELLRRVGALAETAELSKKTLLLWLEA